MELNARLTQLEQGYGSLALFGIRPLGAGDSTLESVRTDFAAPIDRPGPGRCQKCLLDRKRTRRKLDGDLHIR